MKEVNLLAHGVGKSQEVQLILGMSQTKCLNKLIGFDYWSLFSLISIFSWLVVEILKSEPQFCSFFIPMFPENKGNCSVSPCLYYSLQKELYWPFLFGPNLAFIFCPHSYAEQVWKKASVCFDTQKNMHWGDIAENHFWQMFSSLFQSQWQKWLHADTCHFISFTWSDKFLLTEVCSGEFHICFYT